MIKGLKKVKIEVNLNLNDSKDVNTFLDILDFFLIDINRDCDVYFDTKGENECLWKIDFK